MGKQNAGRWTERSQPLPATAATVLGVFRYDDPEPRAADGARRITQWCLACSTKRGHDAAALLTRGFSEAERFNAIPNAADERDGDCNDCGLDLVDQIPLRCPGCGQDACFETVGRAWVHIGRDGKPHAASALADGWQDYEEPLLCSRCDFQGEWDAFRPVGGGCD